MATITIEIGRRGKKKERSVSFLVCHGKTKKRIPTEITVTDTELSSNGKRVRTPQKAMLIEKMRRELQDRLMALSMDIAGREVDAAYIAERLTLHKDSIDFFEFADDWLEHSTIRGKKNYSVMLHSLERFLKRRQLPFTNITFKLLSDYKEYLKDKPRAQTLYLGELRHLYREAMRRYNTDYEQVISNDPFMRFRVPKQVIRMGVRALTLEQLLLIYNYKGRPHSRAQMARDCFILSFGLMGMNSVDMFECTQYSNHTIRYNRSKTKDRRSDAAYIEVKVHPLLQPLVKKYRGTSRVFDFCNRYYDRSVFNSNINKGLKEVGAACGIEGLQFYQARHTFATLSRNLMRFSKSDVDEALNHVGTMDIADIYIAKDFEIINSNNAKLIERVFINNY